MSDQTTTKQRRTWKHQEDNRERLIAAGYTILSEKGIEATTVKEIAHLAEVSPGLFHYYFASKDELLLAVLLEAGKRFAQQLMQELQTMQSEQNFSDVAMIAVSRAGSRDPAWYRLRYELFALGLRKPAFLPKVGEFLAKGRQGIAQVIQERTGVDEVQAQAIAAVVLASSDGLGLQHLALPDFDFTAAYRLVQRLFVAEPPSKE